MKQVVPDKHTIAWFKLAECVARGERERALGVYRLLAHSIGNPAFESQLEGDLYLSFNDVETAVAKYQEAVKRYQQTGCFLEAAAVLEHLATLQPHMYTYHQQLIELYHQLRLPRKVQEHITRLLERMTSGKHTEQVDILLNTLSELNGEYADFAMEILASQAKI